MINLEIGFKPKNYYPLPINYRNYLENILYLLSSKSDDILNQLFYSDFKCSKYEIDGSNIIFKDKVDWTISSQNYDIISNLVQCFFNKPIVKIGKCEFEVVFMGLSEGAELKSKNEFKLMDSYRRHNIEIA